MPPSAKDSAKDTPQAAALAMIADAHPAAVDELLSLVESVDHQVGILKREHLGPEYRGIPSFLARLMALADERSALIEKGTVLARKASMTFGPPPADPILTDGEALADFLLSRGHAAVADLHHFRETTVGGLREKLATLEQSALGWIQRYATDPNATGFNPHFVRPSIHEATANAAEAIAAARTLRGRLAAIEPPESDRVARQAASVSAAVDAAGGAEAVARGLAEASALEGLDAGPGEDGPVIRSLEAERAELAEGLARVGVRRGRAIAGTWAAKASARLDEIDAALEEAGDRVASRRLEGAAGLVGLALAGDEPSRQAVYGLVARRPDCFAPGLAAALAGAYAGRDSLLHLARALAG